MKSNEFEQESPELSIKAAKLRAFKQAMHERQDLQGAETAVPEETAYEIKPEIPSENGFSAKIAKRVQNIKNKSTSETFESSIKAEAETEYKKKKKKRRKPKTVKENLLSFIPLPKDGPVEIIRKIIFLGSFITVIVCGIIVCDYYWDLAKAQDGYGDITYNVDKPVTVPQIVDNEPYYIMLKAAEPLYFQNNETVGYMRIPDTKVDYPVVQGNDNMKYLNLTSYLEDSRVGAIFLDYRNSFDRVVNHRRVADNSDNIIVYGHNMNNGTMFGDLRNYKNNVNYYGEHPVIDFNSNYITYKYKIFAFFIADADDKTDTYFDYWNSLDFDNRDDFYNYVNEAKRRSIRLNSVDIEYGDQLLTLSTCSSIFGQGKGGRMVVMARLVRPDEDPLEGTQDSIANPNIKWPSLYYKYNKKESYDADAEFIPYPDSNKLSYYKDKVNGSNED